MSLFPPTLSSVLDRRRPPWPLMFLAFSGSSNDTETLRAASSPGGLRRIQTDARRQPRQVATWPTPPGSSKTLLLAVRPVLATKRARPALQRSSSTPTDAIGDRAIAAGTGAVVFACARHRRRPSTHTGGTIDARAWRLAADYVPRHPRSSRSPRSGPWACNHEQQHQRADPHRPQASPSPAIPPPGLVRDHASSRRAPRRTPVTAALGRPARSGLVRESATSGRFAFDNEHRRHRVCLPAVRAAPEPARTAAEYLGVHRPDGGYDAAPSSGSPTGGTRATGPGLATLRSYWHPSASGWMVAQTLAGMRAPVRPGEPVCHVSYSTRRTPIARLPDAARARGRVGAVAADRAVDRRQLARDADATTPRPRQRIGPRTRLAQMFGDVWEWTQSSYSPYPGLPSRPPGALGVVQLASSCATRWSSVIVRDHARRLVSHIRATYRPTSSARRSLAVQRHPPGRGDPVSPWAWRLAHAGFQKSANGLEDEALTPEVRNLQSFVQMHERILPTPVLLLPSRPRRRSGGGCMAWMISSSVASKLLGHVTSSAISSVACRAEPDRNSREFAVFGVEPASLTKPSVSSARPGLGRWRRTGIGRLEPRSPLSRGLFGQADARDSRIGISAAGDVPIINRPIRMTREPLDAAERLVVCDVRQPRRSDGVADGADARDVR